MASAAAMAIRVTVHPPTICSARIAHLAMNMTAPAHPLLRVLRFMERHYNEHTPIGLPAWHVAEQVGCKERDVWKHWTTLVTLGYVVEHPRPTRNDPRQFTLVPWPVAPVE